MTPKDTDLGTAPIGPLLFKLAVPTVLAQLVNMLYNLVDRMYIGRMEGVGSLALAGLGVAFPIILIISAFSALVGMGGAPRAAIKMGEGDNEGAERILGNAFLFLTIISVVLTAFFYLTKTPLLKIFGASTQTLPFASDYLNIYLAGTVFVQMALGLNAFISTQGFAKTSMITVMIGAIINIVLDPILIFGFDMGVKGAALATIISQGVSAIWVIMFLSGKRSILRIKPKYMHLDKNILLPILALGVSPFIMQSTESLVQLTFNAGMARYGNDAYVAAMAIIFSTLQVVLLPLQGLTQGAQPIISYNYGARNTKRVKEAFRLILIAALTFSILAWAACMFFPQIFVMIFSPNDPTLMEIGTFGIRIYMAGMCLMGAQLACQSTFIALGQAKISMFLALLRKVILVVPLAIILPLFGLGTTGLFLAEPIADVLAVATTCVLFAIHSKKIFAQMDAPLQDPPTQPKPSL